MTIMEPKKRNRKNDEMDLDKKDEQVQDLANYKGIYFGDDKEKFTDKKTGAHFRYQDMFKRLQVIKTKRNTDNSLERSKKHFTSESSSMNSSCLERAKLLI